MRETHQSPVHTLLVRHRGEARTLTRLLLAVDGRACTVLGCATPDPSTVVLWVEVPGGRLDHVLAAVRRTVGLTGLAVARPAPATAVTGLRTHLAVSLGAALFGVISTLGFAEFEQPQADTNIRIDVTRVASQVVVGIGFLGAGVIFRRGADVKNLTTAATLWATAAIGLAAGVGDGGIAIFAALALVFVLAALRIPRDWVRRRFTRTMRVATLRMTADADRTALDEALGSVDGARVSILATEKHDGRTIHRLEIEADPGRNPGECVAALVARPDVEDVQFVEAGRDT